MLVAIPSIAYLLLAINTLYTSNTKLKSNNSTIKYIKNNKNIAKTILNLQIERRILLNLINEKSSEKIKFFTKQIKLTNSSIELLNYGKNDILNILANTRNTYKNGKRSSDEIKSIYTNSIEKLLTFQEKGMFDSHDKEIIERVHTNSFILSNKT